MEKQLSMEDFGVQVVDSIDVKSTPKEVEKVEPELVNYHQLTSKELIQIIESKDTTIKNYEKKTEDMEAQHKQEVDNISNYYKQRLSESNSLVAYYERKMHILKSIIDIETGGEKSA